MNHRRARSAGRLNSGVRPQPELQRQINFSKEEKALIVRKIQLYFSEELKQEIGQFDAEFLIDFVSQELGGYFYNRGLYDAQSVLNAKVEDIQDAIYQLEQRTDFKR